MDKHGFPYFRTNEVTWLLAMFLGISCDNGPKIDALRSIGRTFRAMIVEIT